MSDDQEFAAFAAQITASGIQEDNQPQPEQPAAAETVKEPPTAEEKPIEAKPVEKKEDDKKAFDWREAAAKEKARREARRSEKVEHQAALDKARRWDELEQTKSKSKLQVLKSLGIELEELNGEFVDTLDGKPADPTPAEKEAARFTQLEQKLAAMEAQRERDEANRLQSRRDEVMTALRTDIDAVISSKPDEFEITSRDPKGKETVINLLAAHFAETGKHLDIQEALTLVEEHLIEKHRHIATAKKFQTAGASRPISGISTLSGDLRQSEPRQQSAADEDKAFLELAQRLNNQTPA